MVNCCYKEEKCPSPDAIYKTMDMCLQVWECTKKECPNYKIIKDYFYGSR